MSEWREVLLGELAAAAGGAIKTGPFGSQLHSHEYTEDPGGVPVVMPKDMVGGRVDRSSVSRVDEATAVRLNSHRMMPGDLALARRGDVGRLAFIEDDEAGWLCGTGTMRVHAPDRSVIWPGFLRHAMRNPNVIDWLRGQAVGATMPNLNGAIVAQLPLAVPQLLTQKRIAAVLAAFDDLIAINELRIELLEELAGLLYREWFVRFRFPGHQERNLVDTDMGPIPRGWQPQQLGDVCSFIGAGGTPRRSDPTNWDEGTVSWFKTGELKDGPLTDSVEKVVARPKLRLFEPPMILMAIYGSPTVGRLGWVTQTCSCNQAALALRAEDPAVEQDWLWFQLQSLRAHFNSMSQGAAQQNISKEKVVGTTVAVPPPSLLTRFSEQAGTWRRLSHELFFMNERLSRTRDLLLPRLVTGRLDISGIDLGDLLPEDTT